jgi:hypothetical protein
MVRQVIEEVLGGLAKAVDRLLEFEDQVTVRLKTGWLTHICVVIRTNEGMNESICNITLGRNEFMRVANTIIERTMVHWTTGAQVSKKSTPSTCMSPCIQK